jgi:hypothetical protein
MNARTNEVTESHRATLRCKYLGNSGRITVQRYESNTHGKDTQKVTVAWNYALNVLAGLTVFNFFAEVLGRAPSAILAQPSLVTKVRFPLMLLPAVTVGVAMVHVGVGAAAHQAALTLRHDTAALTHSTAARRHGGSLTHGATKTASANHPFGLRHFPGQHPTLPPFLM